MKVYPVVWQELSNMFDENPQAKLMCVSTSMEEANKVIHTYSLDSKFDSCNGYMYVGSTINLIGELK